MGYTEIFGGSAVWPSNQTYSAITLSTDTQLSWPIESVSSEIIVADLMDITPINQNGWNLTLPDATGGSTGVTMIVNNLSGTYSFNVIDTATNLIVAGAPGTVWLIYLADNSTTAGTWRTLQYGAQAGSVNVASIAGAGLLAIGSSLNQSMPVSGKATNYTAVNDDRASVILWTGAAGTLTLPSAAGVASNWFINVVNQGTGTLVVSPPSGTIDGAASKNFTAGTGTAIVFTDGTNYYTLGYGGAGSSSGFGYTTINAAGSDGVNGVITLSGGQLDKISYKVFGILTGTRTIIVPSSTQQYWIDNQTTSSGGPYTLSIRTSAQTDPAGGVTVSQPGQAIMYCDGTNVRPAVSGITLPVPIASGGTGATTAAAARTNLGSTPTGDAVFTAVSAAAARTALGPGVTGDALFLTANASAALTVLAGGTLTGALTVSGLLTAGTMTSGNFNAISATVPANGMYYLGANRPAFSSNTTLAGYFDAAQNLILTHPLGTAQGGTGATTKVGIAANIGEDTVVVSTLAARNAAGDILARIFNMNFAADNLAISHVMYQANGGDGYLRRMTLANFNAQISPDALSTASGSAPSYAARAWARVSSAGALIAGQNIASAGRSALGTYFVTFTSAMADTNYAVIATNLHITGNFIMAANEAETSLVAKTTSQVGIFIGVPGAAADAAFSVVIYR